MPLHGGLEVGVRPVLPACDRGGAAKQAVHGAGVSGETPLDESVGVGLRGGQLRAAEGAGVGGLCVRPVAAVEMRERQRCRARRRVNRAGGACRAACGAVVLMPLLCLACDRV
jgi:hypothetical protein